MNMVSSIRLVAHGLQAAAAFDTAEGVPILGSWWIIFDCR